MANEAVDNDSVLQEWSRKEEITIKKQELAEILYPRRSCFHAFFVMISFICGLSAILMGSGQLVGTMFQEVEPIQYVLRIYIVVICVLIVFNELEWTVFTRDSKVLSNWISRGIVYSFVGVIGIEENMMSAAKDLPYASVGLLYVEVVSWAMIGCGIIYFVMGLLCGQLILNRLRQDYQQKLERAKERRRELGEGGGLI